MKIFHSDLLLLLVSNLLMWFNLSGSGKRVAWPPEEYYTRRSVSRGRSQPRQSPAVQQQVSLNTNRFRMKRLRMVFEEQTALPEISFGKGPLDHI